MLTKTELNHYHKAIDKDYGIKKEKFEQTIGFLVGKGIPYSEYIGPGGNNFMTPNIISQKKSKLGFNCEISTSKPEGVTLSGKRLYGFTVTSILGDKMSNLSQAFHSIEECNKLFNKL